jgi:alpha,alpha-trehalase
MKNTLYLIFCLISFGSFAQEKKFPPTPDVIYGQLFYDIQLQKALPDGKTFVDCTPKRKVADILKDYNEQKSKDLDLKKFVTNNFNLPYTPKSDSFKLEKSVEVHIKKLWPLLKRKADFVQDSTNSILPLPYPYIVPGGRFREIYYWDSYFTMLGLKESGEIQMMENMVKNFAYLINTYGHIPNGNRSYYLSRSQPPYFSLMVDLLASIKDNKVYKTYLSAMQKEYDYWMKGSKDLKSNQAINRVVKMQNGAILNRYWDTQQTPRQESYKEDYETAEATALKLAMRIKIASPEALKNILDNNKAETYRNLRAGACSGWDFSSRWFEDYCTINTIQTTKIIPVDLNCLLYAEEKSLSKAYTLNNQFALAKKYNLLAKKRKSAINNYCWSCKNGFYYDYNFFTKQLTTSENAAALYPLFVNLASATQAKSVAKFVKINLLEPGGVVTTTINTGQQWDSPNGWAPLQWVAVKGLNNYEQNILAKQIAHRWISLNNKVYKATGKMMEKYDVVNISKPAGGGEYPSQDGFGWTNGVYLALKKLYN